MDIFKIIIKIMVHRKFFVIKQCSLSPEFLVTWQLSRFMFPIINNYWTKLSKIYEFATRETLTNHDTLR